MNAEFFSALEQLEKEKGISQKYMLEKSSWHSSPPSKGSTEPPR